MKEKTMTRKYSFKELLTQEIQLSDEEQANIKIDKISIPILQRDYAQGRVYFNDNEKKYILNHAGEKFINEIFSTLLSPDGGLELDFIYGSIATETTSDGKAGKVKILSPLDGQQRLTTLFLLYWYIGGRELGQEERKDLSNMLKNFTYLTRTSSTRFCGELANELVNTGIDFASPESIISQIENLHWFFRAYYKLDPTVKAMLNMLERIHSIYNEKKCVGLYEKLEGLKFYILPLENFKLTEQLYVKMNARGKQLTDLENFKADLQDWLRRKSVELDLEEQTYCGRKLPYDLYFINKMDNEWLQCFWNATKGDNLDELYLKFFYNYLLNNYILKFDAKKRSMDKEGDYLALNESKYFGFAIFEKKLNKDVLNEISTVLDNFSCHYDEIKEVCNPVWKAGEFDALTSKLQLKERTIFCALVLYLKKFDKDNFNKDSLQNWLHFAWNIAENANIDSVSVMAGVNKLFEELSQYSGDIYTALANKDLEIEADVAKNIVKEERLKAELIKKDPNWKQCLLEAEAHPFFKGCVGFLLPPAADKDIDDFNKHFEMAKQVFDEKGINEEFRGESHIFLRALISRYENLEQITHHIADTDEKEHSLKQMLLSDEVVRAAIYDWFSLPSKEALYEKLKVEIEKDSPIERVANDFDYKLHIALYKQTDLINWMQEKNAIRYEDDRISEPKSQTSKIYVKGYRNEIIAELLEKGWSCKNQCYLGEKENAKLIPYFWPDREIEVTRSEKIDGKVFNLSCKFEIDKVTLVINDIKSSPFEFLNEVCFKKDINTFLDKILSWFDDQKKQLENLPQNV